MHMSKRRRSIGCALLAACAPVLIGSTGTVTNLRERLLAAHNRERAGAEVPPLRWSAALEASARSWAAQLDRTGTFRHQADRRGAEPQGENLWMGTSGYFTAEAMVGEWTSERRLFRPGRFPDNSRTGRFEDIGHYTQLMWRNTDRVGCALARGNANDVLVCRYSQAGNVIGERPF